MAMEKEHGDRTFPIWLLGDSNPINWHEKLRYPLDSLHPARHNIWTPILDEIQDKVYVYIKKRINTKDIYIRNAVYNSATKPKENAVVWTQDLQKEIEEYSKLIKEYKPTIIFSFGAFSYEFLLRATDRGGNSYNHWDTKNLGEDFRKNLKNFNINITNPIPLLHTSISRGRFLESHKYFCDNEADNYFEYTGQKIAAILIEYEDHFANIWYS